MTGEGATAPGEAAPGEAAVPSDVTVRVAGEAGASGGGDLDTATGEASGADFGTSSAIVNNGNDSSSVCSLLESDANEQRNAT